MGITWDLLTFCPLTRVGNRNPLVDLIVIWHSVELAAQHLPKRGLVLLAGFGVARPITLPFPSAVLASKLWSIVKKKCFTIERATNSIQSAAGGHSYLGLLHSLSAD